MSFASSLGIPRVHFDSATGVATIIYEVSADHIPCILAGLVQLESAHGSFHIPDTLPPDVANAAGNGEPE